MSNAFSIENFFADLEAMGIRQNDVVLINLNIEKFGLIKGFRRQDYVDIFKQFFGEKGTFAALAFTKSKLSLLNKNLPYFDGTQPAYTGAFANTMLKDPTAKRSLHPTNSIVAIGPLANALTEGIDEQSGAYDFARRLIELNGKVLLIGMGDYPGFVTHLVEQDLGLYKRYWSRFFLKVQLPKDVYWRRDPGGCSKTFAKLYPEYIKREILLAGRINGAYSLSVNAKKCYEADYDVIKADPSILICDDPWCSKCHMHRWTTAWKLPLFGIRKLWKSLR